MASKRTRRRTTALPSRKPTPNWKQWLRAGETSVWLCFTIGALTAADTTVMLGLFVCAATTAVSSFMTDGNLEKGIRLLLSALAIMVSVAGAAFMYKPSTAPKGALLLQFAERNGDRSINALLTNIGDEVLVGPITKVNVVVSDKKPNKANIEAMYMPLE